MIAKLEKTVGSIKLGKIATVEKAIAKERNVNLEESFTSTR